MSEDFMKDIDDNEEILNTINQIGSGLTPKQYDDRKKLEKNIEDIVFEFKTEYEDGYTYDDISNLLSEKFPKITREIFNEKLGVVTGIIIDGKPIIYHCDVALALKCAVSNRKQTIWEFD